VDRHRLAAVAGLVCLTLAVVLGAWTVFLSLPRGLVTVGLLGLAVLAFWEGVRRRGPGRSVLLGVAGVLVAASLVLVLTGGLILEGLLAIAGLVGAVVAQKVAFSVPVHLEPAIRPSRPVVVWNPRSGGGKAARADLASEARARGIEPIELKPGDDLVQLVQDAVARGADALAAAGGDGTQALVASIAAEHDLPFACIPAGTRNHFALDLGVDRDDVVGALDAFVSGGERRVDLADVNGRTFVNNVSLGLYADAVQRPGYRDAKLRTILNTVPDLLGDQPSGANLTLRWTDQHGQPRAGAVVILVSNNTYRLGRLIASGTRPRIDEGLLGIALLESGRPGRTVAGGRGLWHQWSTPTFTVDASGPVPVGVDGEALVLDSPLAFSVHHHALRVRLAPHHPGASPSATQPATFHEGLRMLIRIAGGADIDAVLPNNATTTQDPSTRRDRR
jgi:diacylglycerol kinase family enzyme